MDIRGARSAPRDVGTPRISIHDDDTQMPFGSGGPFSSGYDRSMSGPVGIPNARTFHGPPPALPPPKFVPHPGPQADHTQYFDRLRKESYSESLSRFGRRSESNYGSLEPSWSSKAGQDDVPAFIRRDSVVVAATKDEGYSSLSSYSSSGARGSYDHGPGFGRVHSHYQLGPSESYDHQQLKKLDSKRALDNKSPPRASALSLSMQSLQEGPGPNRLATERQLALPRLTLAARPKSGLGVESPRFADSTLHSAVSPRDTHFTQINRPLEYRSPIETMSASDADRSPFFRTKRQNSGPFTDDLTSSDSYDHEVEYPMESRLSHFHLDESRHSRVNSLSHDTLPASLKRRASSPPGEEFVVRHVPSHSDLLRRRDAASRGSPAPRLSVNPPHGSISSVSSGDRSGSFGGLSTATSMTSSLSFGRRSPIGLSPSGMSPIEVASSPFATPTPVNLSPRSTTAPRTNPHQRGPSDVRAVASPRKLTDPGLRTGGGVGKIQGFHMCDCCPKKPKKFDTYEELAAHEAEKQYECSFCGNRFKNKNEAERHQNSLHVRRHSWSCSALSTCDRAFHESTTRPGEADTCGYCGEEFARTGLASAGHGHGRQVTDQDWDERIRHLSDHHKFKECNSSKKFFRADHFRQHLKHSHAGTSGKWTNMLENACMIEEELPQPISGR